ncbi:hypothetical protein BX616_002758 [Lobosporangium transversale]|uniref:Uncharacterized protein n=1 Tax=Lobosporangium transversale TaxID=64571 RepID=A0A1Y2GKE4_9FUNG|nr:hypothetical protein BCR41DRAFT_422936 [Lobosporangium transversale]KAF9899953.1 hypothetical protein BX616_002758 [Lobosporangium transversale]ORZ13427.1 hypothetical protein BCR41DRAFT_422936 [Lobosporangium transversale]|eukprot:XP_021880508.1 hypothetical protein BCR41DRAFT_422936 [Lobosporangium transversale]
MSAPSANDARSMAQAILMAHLHSRHHDLLSWASVPLKQHILSHGESMNSYFKPWPQDEVKTFAAKSYVLYPTTATTIEHCMRRHSSLSQPPFAVSSPSSFLSSVASPTVFNCHSWESASVFFQKKQQYQQALDTEAVTSSSYSPCSLHLNLNPSPALSLNTALALVPVGESHPGSGNLWGVVLVAERNVPAKNTTGIKEGDRETGAIEEKIVWRYHHLTVIPLEELVQSNCWIRDGPNFDQGLIIESPNQQQLQQQQAALQPTPTTFSCPQPHSQFRVYDQVHQEQDDDSDDSDDDYWGQYSDAETESPVKEKSPTLQSTEPIITTSTQDFINTASVTATEPEAVKIKDEDENEEEDDDYWHKYAIDQHDEEEGSQQSEGEESDHRENSYEHESIDLVDSFGLVEHGHVHGSGSESKRILASFEDTAISRSSGLDNEIEASTSDNGSLRLRGMSSSSTFLGAPASLQAYVPGPVDPVTLTMLLERLITNVDQDNEDEDKKEEEKEGKEERKEGERTENERDFPCNPAQTSLMNEEVNIDGSTDYQQPSEGQHSNVFPHGINNIKVQSKHLLPIVDASVFASTRLYQVHVDQGDCDKGSPCSRLRVQSLPSCISSTNMIDDTFQEDMQEIQEATIVVQGLQDPSISYPSSLASPLSSASACVDSVYDDDHCDGKPSSVSTSASAFVPTTDTRGGDSSENDKESIRHNLLSAVMKASVSGISKNELLGMLDTIYEASDITL